jgi:anti-sigma B factor antagonist
MLSVGRNVKTDIPEYSHQDRGKTVALKITNYVVDGVAVEVLEGRIVLGEESNGLREKIKSLLAAGHKKIVLNMDNVTYIDSSGLGTLVASHESARMQGANLKLAKLGSKFKEILQLTKLITVFDLCDSEEAAIKSFLATEVARSGHREPSGEEIAHRAHELYVQRGGNNGKDVEDWVRAEKELRDVPVAVAVKTRAAQAGRYTSN